VPPPSVFDRQVLAFGSAMQALLGRLNIGVVGCGGTGSAVAEQLIRMGVGTLTVVDFDTLSDKNVTRVHGSTKDEVGLLKTEVLRRHAEAIGLGTTIVPIDGSAAERDVADALRACDVVFGCTDDHSGQLVLARLAYWFLIPVLDVGAKIEADEGTLVDIVTRLNVQVPGAACAVCWGAIDLSRAHAEHLTRDERHDLEFEGYVADLDEPDPAVVTYTTLVASLAVHEMIGRLTGVLTHAGSRVMFLGAARQISSAVRNPAPGHWCGKPSTWGTGMTPRFLDQAWPK
jgi:ethanolamine utilization microcompartment shell protein EutS